MDWIRYLLYFLTVAFITGALTQMEISSPGSLKLHIIMSDSDVYGTSEFSPVEIIQLIILLLCGLIMGWVARYCPTQRPIAFGFGGLAGAVHVAVTHDDMKLQAAGRRYLHLRQGPGDEGDSEEVQQVANPVHKKLYTAHRANDAVCRRAFLSPSKVHDLQEIL